MADPSDLDTAQPPPGPRPSDAQASQPADSETSKPADLVEQFADKHLVSEDFAEDY